MRAPLGELAETRAARAWARRRARQALERLTALNPRTNARLSTTAPTARARAELERRGLFERRTRRAARLRVSGVRRNTEKHETRNTGSALVTVYDLDEDAAARRQAVGGRDV